MRDRKTNRRILTADTMAEALREIEYLTEDANDECGSPSKRYDSCTA